MPVSFSLCLSHEARVCFTTPSHSSVLSGHGPKVTMNQLSTETSKTGSQNKTLPFESLLFRGVVFFVCDNKKTLTIFPT